MTDHLDRSSADRLLADPARATDVAPALASLLREAAETSTSEPSPDLLTAMAHEARSAHDLSPTPRRKHPVLAKIVTAKVAAVTAAVALTATGAAAATGSLPDPAQDGIAGVVERIGVDLPDSADDRAREATSGLDASETEEIEETEELDGPDELDGPQAEDNHGADVSAVATDPGLTGAEKGEAVSDAAKDNHGQSVAGENAGEHEAPVATPNEGEAGTTEGNPAAESAPVETPNRGAAAENAPPAETPGADASATGRADAPTDD